MFQPIGHSLRLSDSQIRVFSLVSDDDIERAILLWRWLMPDRWKPMLSSRGFRFHGAKWTEDGRIISDDDLKRIIFLLLMLLGDRLVIATRTMVAGNLSLDGWQRASGELIKQGYVASMLLGGGNVNIAPINRANAFEAIRFSIGRLEHFARLIEERTMPRARTEGALISRIRLYANYGNSLYEESRRAAHSAAGYTHERNVLGVAEHCDKCLGETERGWVPIGSLIPVGKRTCKANCKCHLVFSRNPE